MKNSERIIYGLLFTAVAFLTANYVGRLVKLNISFLPSSFMTHAAMLLLAIVLICVFKKHMNYRIAWPKFKLTLKPVLLGFLTAVIVNVLIFGIGTSLGSSRNLILFLMKHLHYSFSCLYLSVQVWRRNCCSVVFFKTF